MNVFLYARVSTREQGKKHSIEGQIDELKAYCAQKGYDVIKIFTDIKGGLRMDRDGLQNFLESIVQCDLVLVTEWDRLTRHPDHKVIIKYELKRAGKNIIAINETNEKKSEFEEFTERLIALINWWENKRRALRAERGRKKAIEKGIRCYRPPLSETDPTKYFQIIEMRRQGMSFHKIAKSVQMSPSTIHNICSKIIGNRTAPKR
ncbi:recombinase family protein [Thermodesulfobacteriota bacterium]